MTKGNSNVSKQRTSTSSSKNERDKCYGILTE